jgi:ParB family transcriptional regulator, chromosome partitioning protein
MKLTTVPLSALLTPKDNPRRTIDSSQIEALAQSIRADGVLQNLLVHPEGKGKFRVVFGQRRYLALQLLRKRKQVPVDYKVPVEIKSDLSADEALRLATVENIHREQMHPMDEAEAFAKLLQAGGSVETIIDKTGFSTQTVKRRLALASLCAEAKKAFVEGTITQGLAEALTIGSHQQQRAVLESIGDDIPPDAEDVRDMLTEHKPTLAMAVFPREQYTGTLTTDLFATEETTYFDDLDQFHALQKQAVEHLAEAHRKTAAWVDVLFLYSVPWWHYREAEVGEPAGVVINLHPSGAVEVREGLFRHEMTEEVVEETRPTPLAPQGRQEKPEFTNVLIRYVALQKSAAVQAALLRNPRKAKEVAALLLLGGFRINRGVHLSIHPCHGAPEGERTHQRSHQEIENLASELVSRLGLEGEAGDTPGTSGLMRLIAGGMAEGNYEAIGRLSDDHLERLIVLLPILCFGRADHERVDEGDSLFNTVAQNIGVQMRDWWTPDAAFLSAIRKEQVFAVAAESGALEKLQGLNKLSKKEAVEKLSAYFAASSAPEAPAGDETRTAQEWLPGVLKFPAKATLSVEQEAP